jgi:hypothetical protein
MNVLQRRNPESFYSVCDNSGLDVDGYENKLGDKGHLKDTM